MSTHSWFLRLGVAATLAFVAAGPAQAKTHKAPTTSALSAWDQAALERARKSAGQRLAGEQCLKLLTDFTDSEGQPLQRNLDRYGVSASAYLETIVFKDGSKLANCARGSVHLATTPGLPVVFVCPAGSSTPGSRFAGVQASNPNLADYMVIHEMLHTLGLGENPPTTFEITERVIQRCH